MKQTKSWEDVTLKQYYDLLDVIDLHLSDEDKAIAMLSAVSGVDMDVLINKVDVKVLGKAISDLKFIENTIPTGKAKAFFKLKGRKFFFDMVLRDSNASSFISLTENTKTGDIAKRNIHNVMAIFCHELNWWGVKKKRTINSQKEIADFFKDNMNMNDAFLYRDFFLLSYKSLQKATLSYLGKQNKKMMKELKKVQRSL